MGKDFGSSILFTDYYRKSEPKRLIMIVDVSIKHGNIANYFKRNTTIFFIVLTFLLSSPPLPLKYELREVRELVCLTQGYIPCTAPGM